MSHTTPTWIERWSLTPLVKQAPFAVLVALASVLSLTVPQLGVREGSGLFAAIVLTIVATAWSAVVTVRWPSVAVLVGLVPVLDFVALGLLRWATGTSTSVFTALVVLPVVWVAAQEPRRSVVFAVAGTAVTILTPFAFDISIVNATTELVRLGVVIVSYGTLALVVNQLTRAHRRQLRRSREREAQQRAEIERAAQVQRSLLPQPLADATGFTVAGTCLPARTVGGDFLDWYETDGGLALTLGDVMGKGVGAGLLAAAVRAVLRSCRTDADPAAAVTRASQGLAVDPTNSGTTSGFTTLFHARLDGDRLRWVDAGHGLTVIVRRDGTAEHLASSQLPIGLGLDPDERWFAAETRLGPEDTLVCISDGVLDLFGGDLEALDHVVEITRQDMRPEAVVERFTALSGSVEHGDDVTVVALRRAAVAAERPERTGGPSHQVAPVAVA